MVVALPAAKVTHHLSVHQIFLAQRSFQESPLDLWSSYLLPLHLHKVCQGSKARQPLQGPFHLLLPLLQLPRPMLQACVEIVTPTSCRASRHHPPSCFPPALLGPTTQVPTQALLCILHQPVALRSRFATESTSIPVPGKQQLNWLSPGKTAG